MPGGSLTEYIVNHPTADKIGLVGVYSLHCATNQPCYQLSGVAEGLNHLHNCDIIHGNLKGVSGRVNRWSIVLTSRKSNILVDAAGHALVADFGLATVIQDLDSIRSGLDEHSQCAQWIAPEILGGRGIYSKEADVFSFAMVTVEVSCRWRFWDLAN